MTAQDKFNKFGFLIIGILLAGFFFGGSSSPKNTEIKPDPCWDSQEFPKDKIKKDACMKHIEKKIDSIEFDNKKRSM